MTDFNKLKVPLNLSFYEASALRGAVRNKVQKLERAVEKNPDFVPAPGKLDKNRAKLTQMRRIYDTLCDAMDTALIEHKEKRGW